MIAHVALPFPIDSLFSYAVPQRLEDVACPRLRVRVPFRNRVATGVIIETTAGDGEGLKEVIEPVDALPHIDEAMFLLSSWAARHYVTPIGMVLKYALPPALDPERHLLIRAAGVHACDGLSLRKALREQSLSSLMADYRAGSFTLWNDLTGEPFGDPEGEGPRSGHSAHLLVAGPDDRMSRYLTLIGEELSAGRKVLMLLPDRHTAGDPVYRLLSQSLPGQVFWYAGSEPASSRTETFFRARGTQACVILGTRSCVFLPVFRLGLVVAERPEEDEYRNEKDFRFSAVAVAYRRAEMQGVPIVTGSAAPPLDVMKAVEEGAVAIEEFPPRQRAEAALIKTSRPRYVGYRLPEELISATAEALGRGERIAVYVPRRDYASHIYCLECRSPRLCPVCGGSVSYHKADDAISCHRCRRSFPYVEQCGSCGSALLQFSTVGAEYLKERMEGAFPKVPLVTVTGITLKRREARVLDRIGALGKAGIVIGTGILGKVSGFKAENLVLMGLDELLRVAGYRAREKIFQVVRNLSSALEPHRILFCGSEIDPALLGESRDFYVRELSERKRAGFPPYTRLFLITAPSPSGPQGIDRVATLINEAGMGGEMLGPIKEPWRPGWSIVLKCEGDRCHDVLARVYRLRGIRIEADPPTI